MVQRGTRTATKARQVTPRKDKEDKEVKQQQNKQMGISGFLQMKNEMAKKVIQK